MDSADDDDDDDSEHPSDDDDEWGGALSNGVAVSQFEDSTFAELSAPSLLRRLNNHSYLFDGVQSASSLIF